VSTSINETSGTADVAKEQASQVSGAAQEQASAVAGTAKEQAAQVAGDVRAHAQDLMGQTTSQVGAQADEQTQRLAGNLRQVSEHFRTMATSGEPGSTAHTLVDEASRRSGELSAYLDGHQVGEIINDVKGFARRRPGAFILGSAIAGLLVGRLGRAVKDAPDSENSGAAPDDDAATSQTPRPGTRELTIEEPTVVPASGSLGGGL
jgi:hypothetical protein